MAADRTQDESFPGEMRKRIRGGLLIAVDVVPPVDLDVHAGGWQNWSGWRLALGRLNPFGKSGDPPGIVSILQRAGQLPSLQTRRARIEAEIADLYLKPPVQQFRILSAWRCFVHMAPQALVQPVREHVRLFSSKEFVVRALDPVDFAAAASDPRPGFPDCKRVEGADPRAARSEMHDVTGVRQDLVPAGHGRVGAEPLVGDAVQPSPQPANIRATGEALQA